MERVCSVCGGAKKDLFSSTYCPRCEDEVTGPGEKAADYFSDWWSAIDHIVLATGWQNGAGRSKGNWTVQTFFGPHPAMYAEIPFVVGPIPGSYVAHIVQTLKEMKP
jgi:hypothetical protein